MRDHRGMDGGWNHNTHYHPVVLAWAPPDASTALDAGCGEGLLARRLRTLVPQVVGIDLHAPSIARARDAGGGIEYLIGDFLTYPFEAESFDFITSVASLHHMDVRLALERMRQLLRPGGRLAVVGLARSRQPVDLPVDLAGLIAHRWQRRRLGPEKEDEAPKVWPPPLTYGQTRRLATRTLPGARYRRRLLWRYTLFWTKPC